MLAEPAMREHAQETAPSAPQLRTLLLTDLCDSVALVEKLGDAAAAELFQQHDRLVLQLQQQWKGRLIDRSDGLLLLFERPINGLAFAMDYMRGLQELGRERNIVLKARAGMHVGEVLTWHNSAEAVQVGAKPMEVEGLAKPMAARLMALARPGQILLSAVAESLTRRAARELGERSERLLWKSHGRWRFKGVPTSQEIYEAGEIGITPLRGPRSSPKAWRDLPLWRRPAALVAEVALLAVIGIGAWFITRPEPAIAFAERDWVVMGDMRNLTGDSLLDDSLQQAFRISLEQSRYVNVLSDAKTRQTLRMMRQDPATTPVDREKGSEIALRTGAVAVLMPVVTDIGGHTKVSIEVVEPKSQQTVFVTSAEGKGRDSSLKAIETVTSDLRDRLGEAVASIERDSMPLPEVTTASLTALRAFALGQKRFNEGNYDAALGFYRKAVELDPQFALAWLAQVRAHFAKADPGSGIEALKRARQLSSRLPPREAMYLDGWEKELLAPEQALATWEQMAEIYPDYVPAQHNASRGLMLANRFREALEYAQRATRSPEDLPSIGLDQLARVKLAMEDYEGSLQASERAVLSGYTQASRRVAMAAAAKRDFSGAEKALSSLEGSDRHASIERTSVALDRGDWKAALRHAQAGFDLSGEETGFDHRRSQLLLAIAQAKTGNLSAARKRVDNVVMQSLRSLERSENPDVLDDASLALAAGIWAVRQGNREIVPSVVGAIRKVGMRGKARVVDELMAVAEAWHALNLDDAELAQQLIQPYLDDTSRFQTRVVAAEIMRRLGDPKGAMIQEEWLRERRGLAYAEIECGYCLQALNIMDSNVASGTSAMEVPSQAPFAAQP